MKPINLKPWEARAIQSGATLLVRPIKPQPKVMPRDDSSLEAGDLVWKGADLVRLENPMGRNKASAGMLNARTWKSPFGEPGEVLVHKKSGLHLTVKAVRVMRVQELSEADAIKAGIFKWHGLDFYGYDRTGTPGLHCCDTAIQTFASLYRSINGPAAWDRNDWVAVCEFVIERDGKAVGK